MTNRAFDRRWKTPAVVAISVIAIGASIWGWRNLDSSNGNEVMQMLTDLNEQGTTIVMVTHSEHDSRYSHRIIRMLDGQTVTENILI